MGFHLVSLFGPTETFHVPLLGYSKVSQYSELIKGTPLTEATCDKYFGNYFKVLSIEKQGKEADPDLNYYGLCSIEFLGFVQAMFIFQGMLWMALLLSSTPTLLSASRSESKDSEVLSTRHDGNVVGFVAFLQETCNEDICRTETVSRSLTVGGDAWIYKSQV